MAGGGTERSRTRGLSKSCLLLIVLAGMERFAYKGVASNLVTYLTDIVELSNSSAAKMVNSWCGFTSITPLLLAPLADSYWDRFSTILASSFLYLLGLVALTSTALVLSWTPSNKTATSAFLFWSLCLVSVGQGGYNPSLQAFGTDQLESYEEEELPRTKDEKKTDKKSFFFQMWYFGICTGSLLGVTVMSYIQDTFGWVIGFAIPSLAMLSSILFFLCGSRIYVYKESNKVGHHSPIATFLKSVRAAAARLKKGGITLPNDKSDTIELELEEKPLCCSQSLDKDSESLGDKPENKNYIIANSRVVLRLFPIWTMLLMFAVIFQQPATFFTKQGMTMKRTIGRDFKIPPATLQSAITLSIILLMPLYDVLLIPFARLITRNEKGLSVMQRMGIGMVLSIISMTCAALVETKRLEMSHEMEQVHVQLSIFWLLPQYIILGVADIFTVVGMQEFFYNEVPIRMRTMGFALYTSVFGVGSFLSALLISLVEVFTSIGGGHSWFSDDMTEARLDKYYWLLAVLSTLSFVLYVVLCKYHRSRSEQELEDGT